MFADVDAYTYDLYGRTAFAAVSKSAHDTHNETCGISFPVSAEEADVAFSAFGDVRFPNVLGSIGPTRLPGGRSLT